MTLAMETGVILTAVALGLMIWWAFHEVRRVDDVIAEVDRRRNETQEES